MKLFKILFFAFLTFPFLGQVIIFEADFQGGIPSEITLIDNDMNTPNVSVSEYSDAWICVQDPENPIDSVAAATSWFSPVDTADRWMITPQLNLGSYGNVIRWDSKSQDASYPDDYYILASSTDMDPTSFIDTLGYIQQENFEWTSRSVDLSSLGYDGQSIYIAFVLRTFDGFKLYIDDIQVVKEDDASTDEVSNFEFNMFPNPCQSELHFTSPKPIDEIQIYDLSGKIITTTSKSNIQTNRLRRGSYVVKVRSGAYIAFQTLYKL